MFFIGLITTFSRGRGRSLRPTRARALNENGIQKNLFCPFRGVGGVCVLRIARALSDRTNENGIPKNLFCPFRGQSKQNSVTVITKSVKKIKALWSNNETKS